MANRVEIEFLIKAENAKVKALSRDIQELTDDIKFQQVTQGKLTAEQKLSLMEQRAAMREEKVAAQQRVADLKREMAAQRQLARQHESTARRAKMAYLGTGLSIMFAGQALRRFSEGALRSPINTYSEVMGKSSTFGIMTNRLAASWEFLKFSIMDALQQSGLLETVIGWAQSLTNKFIALPDSVKSFGAAILALSWVAGTIMSPIGQIITAMSADWAQLVTNVKSLGPALSKMAGVVMIGYALTKVDDTFSYFESGEFGKGFLSALGVAAQLAGGWLMVKGKTGPGVATFVIGIGLDAVSSGDFFRKFFGWTAIINGTVMGLLEWAKVAITNFWNWTISKITGGQYKAETYDLQAGIQEYSSTTYAAMGASDAWVDKMLKAPTPPVTPKLAEANYSPAPNFSSVYGGQGAASSSNIYITNAYINDGSSASMLGPGQSPLMSAASAPYSG